MLEVQKYLKSNSFESLENSLGIVSNFHPTDSRVILNYSQINSPKKDPVVKECRGLVLDRNTYRVIARAFPRFYNLGECPDTESRFDWRSCSTTEKVDGSLILVYFYNGEWRVNTRNSFGSGYINDSTVTWEGLVRSILGDKINYLYTDLCYVFELCSPYNKIVRLYNQSQLFLLSVFAYGDTSAFELPRKDIETYANILGLNLVHHYPLNSLDAVTNYIDAVQQNDKTFEGFVLRDNNNERIKVKSPTYVALHHLRGEGNNLFSPKYLLPIVMAGEIEEVLTYFPEVRDSLLAVKEKVDKEKEVLLNLWGQVKDIENQKEFALSVVGKSKLSSLLFQARKLKLEPASMLRDYQPLLLKVLFGG